MAMKFRTPPTQAPRRARFGAAGKDSGFTFLIFAIAPAASVAGVMSATTPERSRNTPAWSMMPGFSRPFGPKRTSFILESPGAWLELERLGDQAAVDEDT